jgi:hypothetical protein
MHASGLLLHEFGGHALASVIFACGIEGYDLTFFGHGQVHYADCARWTDARLVIASWAGLVVTTAAGLAAGLVLRRPNLSPLTRLLVSLVAFSFLLGQLGYATTGGFHDLYDPGRTARWLGRHGLHVLAWLPPLLAYTASAFLCARAAIDAFRAHFGSRTRVHTLLQLVATLGIAGALYWAAFKIEWSMRTDMTMRGVAVEAKRVAAERHAPPPFPIEHVLVVILIASLVYALARPVRSPSEPRPIERPVVKLVAVSAATCFLVLGVLIAMR